MKKMLLAATAALCALVSGCATLTSNETSAKLVVSYATLKVIEAGKTPEAQAERAAKIRQIAEESKTFLDTESVTLTFLESAVRSRLAGANLSPADRMLADALVVVVMDELKAKVSSGVLPEDERYRVSTVLGWVISATTYVPVA